MFYRLGRILSDGWLNWTWKHSKWNRRLPQKWLASMPEGIFRQWDGMAKMNVLFAGRWRDNFYVVEDAHQRCSGGSLHRLGNKTSILRILPFLQTGQVVTSMPQIRSNCSCQVSGDCFSFAMVLQVPSSSRHKEILPLRILFASRPWCLILTKRGGKTWSRNLLSNSNSLNKWNKLKSKIFCTLL